MGKDETNLEFVKDRPGHDRRYAVDWSKAKQDLNYEPKASLSEYLAITVDWYKKNDQWWKPLKKNHSNI